jgi:hypothetical protein
METASLTQALHRLVEQRIALQNRASNTLSACGLNLMEEALSSEEKLTAVLELPLDEVARMQLRVIAGQIRTLNKSIAELEWNIHRARTPRYPLKVLKLLLTLEAFILKNRHKASVHPTRTPLHLQMYPNSRDGNNRLFF